MGNTKSVIESYDTKNELTEEDKNKITTSVAGIIDLPDTGVDKYRAQKLFDLVFRVSYGFSCDECLLSIPRPDPHFHCWDCEYDLCLSCEKKKRISEHEHSLVSVETEYIEDMRVRVTTASCCGTLKNAFTLYKDRPCLGWRREKGEYEWSSYNQIYELIQQFGSGLRKFFEPRDFIGMLSENRMEYFIYDYSCILHSFVSVPIHCDFGIDDMNHIICETKMKSIICSPKYLPKLIEAINKSVPESLKLIIVLSSDADLLSSARSSCPSVRFETFQTITQIKHKVKFVITPPDQLLTVVYTSGSTGRPKGVMFSDRAWKNDIAFEKFLLALPRSHDRISVGMAICGGGRVAISSGDTAQLFQDIAVIRPTYFSAPPAIWIKIYKDYEDVLAAALAESPNEERDIVTKRVMKEFGKLLGGRTEVLATGGAHTPPHIFGFVRECFECILGEGYGITEAGGLSSDQRVNPGVEVKLIDRPELGYTNDDVPYPRGEICVKRNNMFMGYFNAPDLTKEVLQDGWYLTGDIGTFVNGRLRVIDRAKSVFKLCQGEFISPEKLEKIYHRSKYVSQIFITAESSQIRVVAIIIPRLESMKQFCNKNNMDFDKIKVCKDMRFISEVKSDISEIGLSENLKYYEIPCGIHLEPEPFSLEKGQLTTTLKFRRNFMKTFYEPEIQKLYKNVEKSSSQDRVREMLLGEWQKLQGEGGIPADTTNLTLQGMNSLGAVHLSQLLSKKLGVPVTPQILYEEDPSIAISHLLGETSTIDWKNELRLPETALSDSDTLIPKVANATAIFVTGATGFLGIFLLQQIFYRFMDARVYCLVRDGGEERIVNKMKESETWKDEYLSRLEIVKGDLALPKFGLSEEEYDKLANEIQVIFHCGAGVNSVIPYSVLKKPNVDGTKEILKLAVLHQRKYLFHISSLSVLDVHDGNGKIDEIPFKALCKKLDNASGYSQSKFVSDMLVRQAIEQWNLKAIIFRPTSISGDTKTGYSNNKDSISIIISGIAKLGVSPVTSSEFDMCPVDEVARSIVNHSIVDDFSSPVYHYTSYKGSLTIYQFKQCMVKCGYEIKQVPFFDWIETIKKGPNTTPLYTLLPSVEKGMGGLTFINSEFSEIGWDLDEVDDKGFQEDYLLKIVKWITQYV